MISDNFGAVHLIGYYHPMIKEGSKRAPPQVLSLTPTHRYPLWNKKSISVQLVFMYSAIIALRRLSQFEDTALLSIFSVSNIRSFCPPPILSTSSPFISFVK